MRKINPILPLNIISSSRWPLTRFVFEYPLVYLHQLCFTTESRNDCVSNAELAISFGRKHVIENFSVILFELFTACIDVIIHPVSWQQCTLGASAAAAAILMLSDVSCHFFLGATIAPNHSKTFDPSFPYLSFLLLLLFVLAPLIVLPHSWRI